MKLIEEYGIPDKIVSSPFRRARETAMVMNMCLENPFEEILIDTNLSEYLGNHNNVPLDVTTATKIHDPPHPETFDDMKLRVRKHVHKMRKKKNSDKKQTIWFITHGLILKQISNSVNLKISKSLPCLTCLSVLESIDMVKGEFLLFKGNLKHERESEERYYKTKTHLNKITRVLNI